jgi:Na+-translocating ferredoxin:NAD+ oxidoreductase RnfC subunit
MRKTNFAKIKEAGIVEIGNAGVPIQIMLENRASLVIVNAVENESFLQAGRHLIEKFPEEVVEGLRIVKKILKAQNGVFCLKKINNLAVERLRNALVDKRGMFLHLVDDYYPAGDPEQLVYEVTGKVVPPGVDPQEFKIFICSVDTLLDIAKAVKGLPVTHRYVTVNGAVDQPVTLKVPLGTSVKKLIEVAKGPSGNHGYVLLAGGAIMGQLIADWSTPVTKELNSLVVLPSDHQFVQKKLSLLTQEYKLAQSLCNHCGHCTWVCPRNALGLKLEPHRIIQEMTNLEFLGSIKPEIIFNCSGCGLCTYYACDMGLAPGRFITAMKNSIKKPFQSLKTAECSVAETYQYRKVPLKRLLEKLGLERFAVEAPLTETVMKVDSVRISLQQRAGISASPVVTVGTTIEVGDLIGVIEPGMVGVNVHASLSGTITDVNQEFVEVTVKAEV